MAGNSAVVVADAAVAILSIAHLFYYVTTVFYFYYAIHSSVGTITEIVDRITNYDEPNSVDARWMDGNLALVGALIARTGELDLQPPVVWMLKMEREPRVRAVRLHAHR